MAHTPIIVLSLTSLAILTLPLIPNKSPYKLELKSAVKMAFLTSTIPAALMIKQSIKTVTAHTTLMTSELMNINMSITLNLYTALFVPTALLVTWSIMEFSTWYIQKTKLTKTFTKFLLLFLISMMVLATAGSLLQLLVGWEGVGIMSFLLINWWFSRADANSAALQAIIYNRIGDIGLILTMAVLATDQASWNTELIMALNTKNTLVTAGLMLAAAGKSAQFFMHLWLPAAMEGPTPVSALLHSSTMVVAGIYLLAQFHPIINLQLSTTVCLLLGMTTSIYAASSALTQNDIKKIIAFSTSSQLGLMMTAIGIGQPHLAIFHMVSHATFKATLFLAAGSMIHSLQNEQDTRKMGALKTTLPISSTMIVVNGLALSGLPFLSGFYSKDAIIEALLSSNLNSWATITIILSTAMTASYTTRTIISPLTQLPNHKPTLMLHETNSQIAPMIRLTLVTIIIGPFLTSIFSNSPSTLATFTKTAPILAASIGAFLATELNKPHPHTSWLKSLYNLLNNLVFFKTFHRDSPNTTLGASYRLSHQLTDLIWLEKSGPDTMSTANTHQAIMTTAQKGLMKNYLLAFIITIMAAMALVCLN
uniref:NADH-ubiquinone oxidoreductase chain 5 n=1 Tax=Draco maculatus TaxID=89026 RepID=A0A6F8CHX3_9SAUR|nr:NADH dehydrogenase subunit 5 [Draco maculatus]